MGWAAALTLAVAVASTPQQFNLECAGTEDVIYIGGQSSQPYKRILRIDLAAKQWCADPCGTVEPIVSIQPAMLVLRDTMRDSPRAYWRETEEVYRVTGDHSSRSSDHPTGQAGRSSFRAGKCELAPFSGFAHGKAKF